MLYLGTYLSGVIIASLYIVYNNSKESSVKLKKFSFLYSYGLFSILWMIKLIELVESYKMKKINKL